MDEIQILIDQMASDVASQVFCLESSRLRLFLEWLVSHSSKVQTTGSNQLETKDTRQLESNLKAWFQSLPVTGLVWEYRLLLGEIAWWRDLDPASFAMQKIGEAEK
jgi:hypothetical protein